MKKLFLFLSLLISSLSFSQDKDTTFEAYNFWMNYKPQSYLADSTHELHKKELNCILEFRFYLAYYIGNDTISDQIIDTLLDEFIEALFLENNFIVLSAAGGYRGCPDNIVDTLYHNEVSVLNLKICHGCTDGHLDTYFINRFNEKMFALLQLTPQEVERLFHHPEAKRKKRRWKLRGNKV